MTAALVGADLVDGRPAGPLAQLSVEVSGSDPGIAHAAWLLERLGATLDRSHRERSALSARGHLVELDRDRTPLEDWAASGAVWLTGTPDGAPVLPPGAAATAARGALLAFELLSAIVGHRVALAGHRLLGERAAALGLHRDGPRSAGGSFRLLAAADGLIGVSLARPSDIELVPALTGRATCEDPWDAVLRWAAAQPAAQAVEWAQVLGMAAAVVPLDGALADLQVEHRGGATPFLVHELGSTADPGHVAGPPLVVDLSSLWAGPLCAHLLGLAGARVVKVESTSRPDGARTGPAGFYDLLHAGHEAVALDFDVADDRAALRALLEAADVVLESSRPRAMAQLGIEPEAIALGRPGLTWASITAYGRTGPWADRVGFGDDAAAAAGLVAVDPASGTTVPAGDAIADPLAGVHAAVAVLASVLGGGSRMIDVALRDAAALTLHRPRIPEGEAPAPGDRNPVEPAADGWIVRGPAGPAEIEPPKIRAAAGAAAPLGAHSASVLAELGAG